MSKPLLAARRYRRAVPVVAADRRSAPPRTPGQYATTRPPPAAFGSGPTRTNRPARRAGTGSLPSRYQRYAVTGCTPCASAHSLKFTNTNYRLLKETKQQLATPRFSPWVIDDANGPVYQPVGQQMGPVGGRDTNRACSGAASCRASSSDPGLPAEPASLASGRLTQRRRSRPPMPAAPTSCSASSPRPAWADPGGCDGRQDR
jgi:hypothetical protein